MPDQHAQRIKRALALMHRYATIGGRSRNGWGSFSLHPLPLREGGGEGETLPVRPWRDALALDWPHAIGKDDKGALIWQTMKAYDDWKMLMRDLAIVKIGLRTQFALRLDQASGDRPIIKNGQQVGINHGAPQERHWLAFPVTNHPVNPWGGKARLPNSLRFKVCPDKADPKKLRGVIVHVPCLPPRLDNRVFSPDRPAIEHVWQRVHAFMDGPDQKLQRIPE